MSELNKKIARRVFEELQSQGNIALVGELFASDFIGHSPTGETSGHEGVKQFISALREAFSDLEVKVEDQVSEGDRVATRWTARGTHLGEFQGIPATGRTLVIRGITIFRLADGKVLEAWENPDLEEVKMSGLTKTKGVGTMKNATKNASKNYQTIVIGGGQAGLATGYYLKQQGQDFIILDENERTGDSWRNRWDSLRLFTPARFDGLPGMPYPASAYEFPTKDEMADYLEAYAERFELPIQTRVRVDRLSRTDGRFSIEAGDLRFEADNVVVAMSNWQKPRVPAFARELDPGILQLHSSEYRNPSQLKDGGVLIVGAGNSGAEIALEVVRGHPTWLSGSDTGHLPFKIGGLPYRLFLARLVGRVLFHHVLTVNTPIGRKARPKLLSKGQPLIRVKPKDLVAAGVQRVPRTVGVQDGLPVLENGRALDVSNIIWSTGYHPGFSWIDLPIFGEEGLLHERGVVAAEPGLYFVGLTFLYAASSSMIHGVGRDADYVVKAIQERQHRSGLEEESDNRRIQPGLASQFQSQVEDSAQ